MTHHIGLIILAKQLKEGINKDIDYLIENISIALLTNPKDFQLYKLRGVLYLIRGENEKSLADFNKVVPIIKNKNDIEKVLYLKAYVTLEKKLLREVLEYRDSGKKEVMVFRIYLLVKEIFKKKKEKLT